VDETNAAGGINGRQIEMVYEDGKCDGKAAALAAQKLVTVDKLQLIVGGACSGETLAAAPIAEQSKVLLISAASSSPLITTAGDYIFRVYPSDLGFASQLTGLLRNKSVKKVALVSEQTDYAQGLRNAFLSNAKDAGMTVVADENFATDISDFKAIAGKLNSAQAEAIFINPQTPAGAVRIIKQLRDLGNTTQVYGVGIFSNDEFAKSGKFVDGMIILDIAAASNKALGDKLALNFKSKFGHDSAFPTFSNATYDTLGIVKGAISKAGYDATKIKDYLYTMKHYVGVIGNISFDTNGDPVGINSYIVKQIKDGHIVDYK
jgi:branched-chain amino acid transport system substrate-binding protein